MTQDEAFSLLERAAIFRHPCDLDLLLFFAGHSRTLLASEALVSYLGYELKQIAESLEVLLAAGLIKRTQSATHPARLYVLVVDSLNDDVPWLPPLLEMASTRQGRAMLKKALKQRSTKETGGPSAATRVETIGKTNSSSSLLRGDARGMVGRRSYRRGGR